MKKILTLLVLLVSLQNLFAAGCTVTGSAPSDTIVCGDHINLSAYGQGQGIALLSENFNSGTYGPGWSSSQQVMWNNPCSANGVDGTTHIWLGNSSPVPRILTTTTFNLSSCVNAGVTICFDMLFAEQGNSAPCEGPDEPQEGVYLQYSTNGTTWTDIHYFDPNGGNDPQFVNWNNWCFQVPAGALTATTQFRWYQDADSGADYDHWGIDNVVIYCNDPTFNIVWVHDGYNLGPVGGVDPNAVSPHVTTNYTVVMSNGTVTCTDTVRVVVRNPTLTVNAGNDTTVCTGQCAQLHATGKVIVSPAKVVTYSNNELTSIATGFGQVSDIGINVTGLNMTNILANSITQVCINNVFFFGTSLFPPGQIDISDLILTLTCPSGTTITLVPANVTNGGSNPLTGGYNNTCFVPGGPGIATGSAPYSGSWSPNQPFNNLTGCTGNGVWTLGVKMNSNLGFGTGTFSGWSITFNDPEISYQGNLNWSPTTNMTGSTTLNPTVCPPPNTYTITVSDTAGCVTLSDAVNVNTQTCCALTASLALTQPTCGASNGAINVTPIPAGTYTYAWSDGPSTMQNRTGLAAGTYTVTITNTAVAGCTFDTTIVLNSNSTLTASLTNPVNPSCAGNDGSITAGVSGGTAPYSVTIDTGATPFTISLPFPISQSIPGIPAGTVSVTVTDAAGCTASATATLVAPANCCAFNVSAVVTQPACSQNNGSIAVTATNGSGNYTYSWGGGQTTASINGIGAGTYTVTITDNAFTNCTIDSSFTLNSNSTLTASFSNQVNPTCAGNDGSITAAIGGGTAPYTVTIDTGGAPFTVTLPIAIAQNIPGIPAGAVSVTVTDAAGCTASANAILSAPANCCTFSVTALVTQPACGQTNGDVTLTASSGSGSYTYNWAGGQTTASVAGLGAGNYAVTITDNGFASCFIDTTFSLTNPNAPVINNVVVVDETCAGTSDGSVTVTASGGNGVLSISWSNAANTFTISGLNAGNYNFTVTDASSCAAAGNAVVNFGNGCCNIQTSATVIPPSCGLNNASVTVTVNTPGNPPYTYSIDGITYQSQNTFNSVPSGSYNVITASGNTCNDTIAIVVPASSNNLNVTVVATNITCFGAGDGTATATPNGGNAPYSYLWSNVGNSAAISSLQAGNYSVTVSDQTNCTGTASGTVIEPAALVIDLGGDSIVCEGVSVTLSAGNSFTAYNWNTTEITASITPSSSGNYSLTVTDNNGCTASDAVSITIVPIPEVDLGEDKIVYYGDHVGLFANVNQGNANGGTYNWQPDTLLSCNGCENTVALALDTITYQVVYTDVNGCFSSDDINLFVLPLGQVFFPNAFTPTGDGNNDIYLPYGSGVKQIIWQLFNRWGEKVFESNNFYYGWDGTYKSQPLPQGVYIYVAKVTLMNNSTRHFKGSVTLIR
ncbi:MAG: gliding motility-associated C-terminal domain-containing protein [Chitinophagales bacterium]